MRTGLDIDRVREIAVAARRAIEASPRLSVEGEFADSWFDAFPLGCCSDACLLVAEIYRAHGFAVALAHGQRGSGSHVWLLVDGVIVDLTADQFEDAGLPAVFVAESSAWHDAWEPTSGGIQAISDYPPDERWRAWLSGALAELRRRVAVLIPA